MRRLVSSAAVAAGLAAGLVLAAAAPQAASASPAARPLTAAGVAGGAGGAKAAKAQVTWQDLLHQGTNAQARSVAIQGGLVSAAGFTTNDRDSPRLTVRTYDLKTGRQLWQDTLAGVSVAQQVESADGVVSVAGFTLSNGQASGFLVRTYDARTGKLLWEDNRKGGDGFQGHALAVAIAGGKVFAGGYVGQCAFDGEPGCSASLRAYDAKTGKVLWDASAGLPTGFSLFQALTVVGDKVYAAGGTSPLLRAFESATLVQAYDVSTGLLEWQAPLTTSDARNQPYEAATSIAVGQGVVAVGGRTGALGVTDWVVRTYDAATGLPKWSEVVKGGLRKADGVNGVAFTDSQLVAGGVTGEGSKAQAYRVRGYDPATGKVIWTDTVASAEDKIAKASENDDFSNQLESALTVVASGPRAYVTGRVGANCDGVSPGNCDMLVRAYDSGGKAVWSDKFDRAGHDDVGLAAALAGDRLVVAGRSTSTNKYGFQGYWIVRAYKA